MGQILMERDTLNFHIFISISKIFIFTNVDNYYNIGVYIYENIFTIKRIQ